MKELEIKPLENEMPSSFADRLGIIYSNSITTHTKKINGQFFTSAKIAKFMSDLYSSNKLTIRILDPGCATCILSCALVESVVSKNNMLKEIILDVYETDPELLKFTKLSVAYLKKWLTQYKVKLLSHIHSEDFILENKECYQTGPTFFNDSKNEIFDVVITNPPYFKISKNDKRALTAKSIINGHPNIYSIFLMTASKLLKQDGNIIAIVPRSFSSGNYFREFRKAFLGEILLEKIHLFGSRKEAFSRDKILQETLIFKAKKGIANGKTPKVFLTHSKGINDINDLKGKEYKLSELIDLNSSERILHLPVGKMENDIIKIFKSWKGNLKDYDIKISTGPVVTFRATNFLFEIKQSGKDFAPLFQLYNTLPMSFDWPVSKKGKAQYIQKSLQSKSLLIPNKDYIFLRRFSAKDDKSRLVASPYFAELTNSDYIGVENHLNYIYRQNGCLERNEIMGLSALFNSSLFDIYFRTFNGNINVSATEIREIPLPPLMDIKKIGSDLLSEHNYSKQDIDIIVNSYFDLGQILIPYEKN